MPIEKETISYELDLTEKLKGKKNKKNLKELIGNYLLDSVLSDTASAKSPVTGKPFQKLSKEYKAIKKITHGSVKADLRFNKDMMAKLKVKNTVKGVKLEITHKLEKLKAFNHITGDTLPSRPFLPDDKGVAVKPTKKGTTQFRRSIVNGIDDLLKE